VAKPPDNKSIQQAQHLPNIIGRFIYMLRNNEIDQYYQIN
jgi:hypothetical protein